MREPRLPHCSQRRPPDYGAWKTSTPPVGGTSSQVAHPAGAVADEKGMKISCVAGSTATACALLPAGRMAITIRVAASTMPSTGVHGDAVEHDAPEDFPLAVHRLSAR